MLRKLLCFFGVHEWVVRFGAFHEESGREHWYECRYCGKVH
jgi:hypothetical protein